MVPKPELETESKVVDALLTTSSRLLSVAEPQTVNLEYGDVVPILMRPVCSIQNFGCVESVPI